MCTAMSEEHIKFVDTYSTDTFLMALRRFMCAKGTPSRICSDRGDQLVTASKQIEKWDFEGVHRWARKKGKSGTLFPQGVSTLKNDWNLIKEAASEEPRGTKYGS